MMVAAILSAAIASRDPAVADQERGTCQRSDSAAGELQESRLYQPVRGNPRRCRVHGRIFGSRGADSGLLADEDRGSDTSITRHDRSIPVIVDALEKAFA
jgi:hypothetical protein